MEWLGLPAATVALGALAIAAALLGLHLLRVRLRRVPVDTLLFFRLAGAEQRPRTLPGRPSRWLAYLLALLLSLLLWAAFGDPHGSATGRSRAIVVALDGAGDLDAAARVEAALTMAARDGLGPRGAVLAAAAGPRLLRRAGEPDLVARERARGLVASAAAASLAATLQLAASLLGEAPAEIVVLGGTGPLPATAGAQPVRRAPLPRADRPGFAQFELDEAEPRALLVELVGITAGDELIARAGDVELARAAAAARVRVDAIPVTATELTVELRRGGQVVAEQRLAIPARPQATVAVAGGLPAAIAAVLEADPLLEPDPDAALQVRRAGDDRGPALLLDAGAGGGAREPQPTGLAPFALGFGDLRRADAPALARRDGQQVWVEDARTGDPLVALERAADGAPIVRVVDWLLAEPHRRDVPRLLAGALRFLAGAGDPLLVASHEPSLLRRPAPIEWLEPAPARRLAAPAVLTAEAPGRLRLRDAAGAVHEPVAYAAAAPLPAEPPELSLAPLGDRTRYGTLLILAALALLLADAWLLHRGRVP